MGMKKGWAVVCNSVTPSRIESNLELDGWELTDDEMTAIDDFKERFKAIGDRSLPIKVRSRDYEQRFRVG